MRRRFRIGCEEECDDIIASVFHPRFKKLKFLEMEDDEMDDSDHENDDSHTANNQDIA